MNKNNLLLVAVKKNKYDDVKEILAKNSSIDINVQDDDGNTPLIRALWCNFHEIACLLLSKGADTNIQNNIGCTALIYKSWGYQYNVIKALIEYGADPDIQNNYGNTALLSMVKLLMPNMILSIESLNDLNSTIKVLLKYNVNINTTNIHCKSVSDYIHECTNMKVHELLRCIFHDSYGNIC